MNYRDLMPNRISAADHPTACFLTFYYYEIPIACKIDNFPYTCTIKSFVTSRMSWSWPTTGHCLHFVPTLQ